MCSGGRLLADFEVGTRDAPDVPEEVSRCLTSTADGEWVVWAHKLAHREGRNFRPLNGGGLGRSYPVDAIAECRRGGRHRAPEPTCTCGFHALSLPWPGVPRGRPFEEAPLPLEVALTGRVLAFDWLNGGVLFRAARQTVIRVDTEADLMLSEPPWPPDDPDDSLARRRRQAPHGAGPFRLRLPHGPTPVVAIADDAGFCAVRPLATTTDREIRVLVGN